VPFNCKADNLALQRDVLRPHSTLISQCPNPPPP
jgi:hypothetical protein